MDVERTPKMSNKVGRSTALPTRNPWIIAAAAASVAGGVHGAAGAVGLVLDHGPELLAAAALGLSLLGVGVGIGLLWLREWARLTAGLLAGYSLFLYASGLVTAVLVAAAPPWSLLDWIGGLGSLVVIYAIALRWPVERTPSSRSTRRPPLGRRRHR